MSDPLTGKAIEEASKLLPEVYKDALQPAMREVGSGLAGVVRTALSPLAVLAWSRDYAAEWLKEAVTARLASRGTPSSKIVPPAAQLAAGVLRGVQAAGPEADVTLRESFANLLATAMDADRTSQAHPAFAEVLAQLTPGEARAIHSLALRDSLAVIWRLSIRIVRPPDQTIPRIEQHSVLAEELGWEPRTMSGPYLTNLTRLGLIRTESGVFARRSDVLAIGEQGGDTHWTVLKRFLQTYDSEPINRAIERFESICSDSPPGSEIALTYLRVTPTPFGAQLLRAITDPKEYGNANFVNIAMWEDDLKSRDLK